jgi:hypothetical protein
MSLSERVSKIVAVLFLAGLPVLAEAQTRSTTTQQRPFGGLPPSQLPGSPTAPGQLPPWLRGLNVPGVPTVPGLPNQILNMPVGAGPARQLVPGTAASSRAGIPGSAQARPQPGQ